MAKSFDKLVKQTTTKKTHVLARHRAEELVAELSHTEPTAAARRSVLKSRAKRRAGGAKPKNRPA